MGHYFINDNNLKSDIKTIKYKINNIEFIFNTDNGVFSKTEIDYGTELLIKNVINEDLHGLVLDLGCGYGPIGIIINKVKNIATDMIDVNERAIELTKMNIKNNDCVNIKTFVSDGLNNVEKKYDYIISNPPIRVGKKKLYDLIKQSGEHLLNDGIIYLVIRKEQGAKSFIKDFSNLYKINILDKSKGFYIISLKKY